MPGKTRFTLDEIRRLELRPHPPTRRELVALQSALANLRLDVDAGEVERGELGPSTTAAIQDLQRRAGLDPTGALDEPTSTRLRAELEDAWFAGSPTRSAKVQELLQTMGHELPVEERATRRPGPATRAALAEAQRRHGLPDDGLLSEALVELLRGEALDRRLSSKTQAARLQKMLLRAGRIGRLGIGIDREELRRREIGPSTSAAIAAFQSARGLPVTGRLDPRTYDRVVSIASSRPRPRPTLPAPAPAELRPLRRVARLNKRGPQVRELQRTLAAAGHPIDRAEAAEQRFGGSTRSAVIAFQASRGLPQTGHADPRTLRALNDVVIARNPAAAVEHAPRVRGSVRDEGWNPIGGARVQVWDRPLRGPGTLLGERAVAGDGFFDIPYARPAAAAGPPQLLVRFVGAGGKELGQKVLFNPTRIAWANLTLGDRPYKGTSEFDARLQAAAPALGGVPIWEIEETAERQEVTRVALASGLSADDVMRLALAHRASMHPRAGGIAPAVVYAFVRQSLPPSLPSDPLAETNYWELIDQLVDRTVSGLLLMEAELQQLALENAEQENLVPVAVSSERPLILALLAERRRELALQAPLLAGNGSLGQVLDLSSLDPAHHGLVADAFAEQRGLGAGFRAALRARSAEVGGDQVVADVLDTADLAQIAKCHPPTLTFLKAKVRDPAVPEIDSPRSLAKLTVDRWVELIDENGGAVPDTTDGSTPEERKRVYATTMAAQAERLFPTVAFTAEAARSDRTGLQHMPQVQALVDANPDVDLRAAPIDGVVTRRQLDIEAPVLGELRVLQRVHRLAPSAAAGRALLDRGVHSSVGVLSLGKRRLVEELEVEGVDQRTALTIWSHAEMQYAQVLMRMGDLRQELHFTDPRTIASHLYTEDERRALLGDIPNLELLFGSLDFCECSHCRSVQGPAAYLADMLRFLGAQSSESAGRSVLDVLFARRPDIGNVLLDCANTEVALPYIDLVCEVLEHAVPAPAPDPDYALQTTRTAQELRASPEHVRTEAYEALRGADFPILSAFDLWQEEARVFLAHLGVPRHVLMEAFQTNVDTPAATPTDASIAGEAFGISSRETAIIVTAEPDAAVQGDRWGLDATATELPVLSVMRHAGLDYQELLDLLEVQWLNPPDAADRLAIERTPAGSCALEDQRVVNVTPARLDAMARIVRLRRATGLELRELDLLIRAPSVGAGALDAAALAALRRFALVRERLGVSFEVAVSLYRPINTERGRSRGEASAPPSLYETLFQNPAVVDPVDPAFALPLDGSAALVDHRAALLAGLALRDDELALLLPRTGPDLTLTNLSALFRLATLARALRLPVADVLALVDLCADAVADPFASPAATLRLLDHYAGVLAAGLTVAELKYALRHAPASPVGLREEAVTGQAVALREALRSRPAAEKRGAIAAHAAAAFGLTDAGAATLIATVRHQGAPLVDHLGDDDLLARGPDGEFANPVTPARFPALYAALGLLHRIALLVDRHRIEAELLPWLLTRGPSFGLLDLGALPAAAGDPVPSLASWQDLATWLALRGEHPAPEGVTLSGIFDQAAAGADVATVRADVATLTAWRVEDLAALDADDASVYGSVGFWRSLRRRMPVLRRLGVDAATALAWADRDDPSAGAQEIVAQQARLAAKSKYDPAAWLITIRPLQDALRERKRDALVAHLVERSLRTEPAMIEVGGREYANPRRFESGEDLLRYFLVDVEMSACQPTSRIKQAIGSVQMFVQRCFLNLERPEVVVSAEERADVASLDSWRQWRWMRSYRVWEANRRVFLHPENWIEPELRDDKSPFFRDLEADLLQGELTGEHCEAAFRTYLEKVHEVSSLHVVSVYHEVDDDNPWDALPPTVMRVHVIARTRTEPAAYFYRHFDLVRGAWTPWERLDLEITGDHVVPVVYNRRLHLFWLLFTERAQKVRKQPPAVASDAPKDVPDPPTQLEIQLAWSTRGEKGWAARRVSPHKLIHPWPRPAASYNLKPRYRASENQLWLDVYISTSREFNNTLFYDPYKAQQTVLTATRHDEAARPWHSSSFVFDGNVVAVRMKALSGMYHVLLPGGFRSAHPVQSTSLQYVREGFGPDAAALEELGGPGQVAPRLAMPTGMRFRATRMANASGNGGQLNVLEGDATTTLLTGAAARFEVAFSQHQIRQDFRAERSPFVYQDAHRAFFVRPEWAQFVEGSSAVVERNRYRFFPFYHPYTGLFLRELGRSGVEGLLNRTLQRFPHDHRPSNTFQFVATYAPTGYATPDPSAEQDRLDFSRVGAYSLYNWEIFFHAPLLIATKLAQNQRFEEALDWFHRIFDPTNADTADAPARYWITLPFFEQSSEEYRRQRIEAILADVSAHLDQVRAWKNEPFNPHLIARFRPVAYQKVVVMKYLDTLIAWGDQLFRRETLEAINEATLVYSLAQEILGRRPERVPGVPRPGRSYRQLVEEAQLDPFGNARVEVLLENFTPHPVLVVGSEPTAEPLPHLEVLYFGIPANDRLETYWDTVEDRLFKVRNCMNIAGAVRQLPLFEPPIDPALLVKAAAAGVDLDSVLGAAGAPSGQYRFRVLVQKALDLCAEVRALGDKLLTVLERRDAEGLQLLQAVNEGALLRAVRAVRREQANEAQRQWDALERGLEVVDKRIEFYGSIPRMNAWEIAGTVAHGIGVGLEVGASVAQAIAGPANLIPQITAGASGFGGSPTLVVEIGGENVARSAADFAQLFQVIAGTMHQAGQMLETQGGYTRRDEENRFQADLARRERAQLEKQVEAARLRHLIAEKELESHDLRAEQVAGVQEYLSSKYTSEQLYGWLLTQVATTYFQSYQLAFDLAKRAERCFAYELGEPTASFVQFGHWDSLRKGLLSGERLTGDVRRMEAAYLERDRRELELTKHVSLAHVSPLALLALKLTGSCVVQLPEWLFDLDHPGHYRRRTRSVALSVPSVVGPYTGINCTLTLTANGVRMTDDVAGGYGDPLAAGDDRFVKYSAPTDTIATSHGVTDRGMFELSFGDDRYLPFEGAGVVSEWGISLPPENNHFDLGTITDVILQIDYTARAGSAALADAARQSLAARLPSQGRRLVVLDQELSTEWHRLLHPDEGHEQALAFTLGPQHLPFWTRARAAGRPVRATSLDLVIDSPHAGNFDVRVGLPDAPAPTEGVAARSAAFGDRHHLTMAIPTVPAPGRPFAGAWRIQLKRDDSQGFDQLAAADVRRAYLVVGFDLG